MPHDTFDDDDDTRGISPEQLVAQGLEEYERGKRMPKSYRPSVFRSARVQLPALGVRASFFV